MPTARMVRTLGLSLVLSLAGLAGGCGLGSQGPTNSEEADQILKEAHMKSHQRQKADLSKQKAVRTGGRRGP
jgi:hypothetical protein